MGPHASACRRLLPALAGIALLAGACGKDRLVRQGSVTGEEKMSEPGIRIEQRGEGIFAVSVVRRAGDHEAGGTVVLRQDQPPDAGSPAHVVLAGSRAWLALGEARFEAGDFEAAVRCAQSGLEELGASYGGARVEDDTEMKILLAKRYLKQGQLEPAASHLLRTLGVRVALYAEHNAAALAE